MNQLATLKERCLYRKQSQRLTIKPNSILQNNKKKRGSTLEGKRSRKAFLFLTPSLLGVSIFVLIPYMDVVRRSFFGALDGKFVGMDNFYTVWSNSAFQMAARNTARFLLYCIPLLLLISLLTALFISGASFGGELFKTSILLPMAIPVASVVLLWKLMFHKLGILNQIISIAEPVQMDWMKGGTAFGVLVFTYLWKNTGYDMVLWSAGLNGISTALYEAAKVDGAGAIARFRYITLPELKPTIVVVTVLSVLNSFKVFREAYLIAGDYPDSSIYMMQHLFNNWFLQLNIQKMSAAAVTISVIVLVPVMVFQIWKWRKGGEAE